MTSMTRENVRAFLDRDWAAARRAKDEGMQKWVSANGLDAALRLAQSLLDQVWPRIRRERDSSDLDALISLKAKLARAGTRRS